MISLAFAEPNTIIKYLLNEPASLKEQESIEAAKAWCTSKIKLIKVGLGYMEDGRQIEKGWSIDSFFTHHNYTSTSEPKNLKESLEDATVIIARAKVKGQNDELTCESKLKQKRILFSK
jgi:hypothetical protein